MKRYLVLGLKKSGYSAAKLLLKEGQVFLYDEDDSVYLDENIKKLLNAGCIKAEKRNLERVILAINTLVISPSIPIDCSIVRMCKNLDKEIIGEIELGFRLCKGKIIAVTGTNGKTTTTTLIDYIINLSSQKDYLLGNIGTAFCSECCLVKNDEFVSLEVSSFQLESIVDFKPKIACLLNLTPDHLNRHKTFEKYCFTKSRIFKNQDYSDYAVINADSKDILNLTKNINSRKYYISQEKQVIGGFCLDNMMYFFDGNKVELIANINEVSLKGVHNIENMLFAITVAKILNIDNSIIKKALVGFSPIEHRLELCGVKGNVKFVNDSKATNIYSTLPALKCFNENVSIILGGSDKGFEFDQLFKDYPTNIVLTVVMGETSQKIVSAMQRFNIDNYVVVTSLEEGINVATKSLNGNGTVLFSPACASFDMFNNFEHRGNVFKSIVEKIVKD